MSSPSGWRLRASSWATTSGSRALPPVGDPVEGVEELGDVGDPVFEQVADAVRAAGDQLGGVALLDPLGQDEDADVGPLVPDEQRGAQALVGERRRHPHVDHADVWPRVGDGAEERLGVARGGDDLVARLFQQQDEALAEQDRVLGDRYAHGSPFYPHGSTAEMIVGPPGGDSTDSAPSMPAMRSARPRRPDAGRVGPADAVVADHDVEGARRARPALDDHARPGGPGVLGDVGERLGDREVRDRLDGGPRPDRHVHLEGDGDGTARGQAGQRRVETAVGKDRRVHAPHEFTELDERGLGLGVRLVDEGGRGVDVVGELRLGPAELHRHGDEPLLRAVVQVTLDPPTLGLGRVHHALPADLELG